MALLEPVGPRGVVVREAHPDEDGLVGELVVRAFVVAYESKLALETSEERRRELRDVARRRREGTVLVALEHERIVGTVTVHPPEYARLRELLPNSVELRALAVEPNHFGRGLAGPLLDAAEALAWSWGAHSIALHVRRGVAGVAGLYAARGYRRTSSLDLMLPAVALEAFVLARP